MLHILYLVKKVNNSAVNMLLTPKDAMRLDKLLAQNNEISFTGFAYTMHFAHSEAKTGLGKGNISTLISKLFMEYYKLAESCTPVGVSWWSTTIAGLQCNLEVHKLHIV